MIGTATAELKQDMDRAAQYPSVDDAWSDTDFSEGSAETTEFSHELVVIDEFDAL